MDSEYFSHPNRFPKNIDGPFYTTGEQCPESDDPNALLIWSNHCLACALPEAEAPELLAVLDDNNLNTYFVRQPETPEEIGHAISAALVCCTTALRYGGKDKSIIDRLGNNPAYCDYIDREGVLSLTVDKDGELFPFAQKIALEIENYPKWWQFWRWCC